MPPETRPDRLSYARGAMDKLRKAHENLSREELIDLVCHLTKTYVLEQTIPFDVPMPERADPSDLPDVPEPSSTAPQDDPEASPVRRFARLVEGLKRRASLPQLDGFSVQDGRAVLIVDNQKVTFGERVTIEFVPVRQSPVGAAPAAADEPPPAPAPRAPGAPAQRPAPTPRPAAPSASPFEPERPAVAGRGSGARPDAPTAAMRPASPGRPARVPGAPAAAAPSRPAAAATPPKPAPEPRPAQADSDDVDQNAIERFRRLELD